MAKFTGITIACTATAESASHQFSSMRREKIVDQVIIGTPGTLKRWVTSKVLDTKNIRILVFDEADQMLDQVTDFTLSKRSPEFLASGCLVTPVMS